MAQAKLTIDLDAIAANWGDLARVSGTRTAAVVKADAYGLGAEVVAKRLAREGVRILFVALAEEGARLRRVLGPGMDIAVFSGHMEGDAPLIIGADLIPMINSVEQLTRHFEQSPRARFGIQLDTGMTRLGMGDEEWRAVRDLALNEEPWLLMSHLACSDEPDNPANAAQLEAFLQMTQGAAAPRSLAATGGIFLGPDYAFDMVRPGVGLYGGLPFVDARPVVTLELPLVQSRHIEPGTKVGYSGTWQAERSSLIGIYSSGYADGIFRALSNRGHVYADERALPLIGRVSMDLIAVDLTGLGVAPDQVELLGRRQSVDSLAATAETIGYEILTALGTRSARSYLGER